VVDHLIAQWSCSAYGNSIDARSLKRAARKLLKHYDLDLHDFPNLAAQERTSFLKTLFVRRYLERRSQDDEAWNEQIKVNSHPTE
jgi:hypothetical protein